MICKNKLAYPLIPHFHPCALMIGLSFHINSQQLIAL